MPTQSTTPGFPWGTTILLLLAALLYAAFAGNLLGSRSGDAAGRGMALGFAAILGFLLWLVIAALFAVAILRGRMPAYAIAAALALVPLSALAAASAAGFYSEGRSALATVPLMLPPLLALYALWARFVGWHEALPPAAVTMVLGGAIVALTIVPLVLAVIEFAPNEARDAARAERMKAAEAEEQKRHQEAEAEEAARFARLGPDSPLTDYLDFLLPGDPRFDLAVAGARLVKSRNADAAALLSGNRLDDLADLWRLDIDPAAVCAAYGMALRAAASRITRLNPTHISAAIDLERQLANMEWLASARCDLEEPLGDVEAKVRAVADSARIIDFANKVAALRKSNQKPR